MNNNNNNNNDLDPILNWILKNETTEANEESVSNELLNYLLNDQEATHPSFPTILPKNDVNLACQQPHQQQPQYQQEQKYQPSGKRKNGHSSPSEEDDNDDPTEDQLKLLPSKERRQLRNKISARNFRNRRKEYMATLEEKLDKCQAENSQLKLELKWVRGMMDKLQAENDQLRLELALCKGGIQQPSNIRIANSVSPPTLPNSLDWDIICPPPPSSIPAPIPVADATTSNTFSSPSSSSPPYPSSSSLTSVSTVATMNPNVYLSHATVPNWDLTSLFRKESASSTVDLIRKYPLLAPALMSIVIQHTMTMTTQDIISNSNFADPTIPLSNSISSYQPRNEDKFMNALADSALWQTIINTKPASKQIDEIQPQNSSTADENSQKQKLAEMKAYMKNYCPLNWIQKQFCMFILFYVVAQYPRLDKPCRTYLPICDKFRIKRQMASLKQ